MHRDELILEKTKALTVKSDFKKLCGTTIRVAASIYDGSTLIAENVNQNKSHPQQKYYNQYMPWDRPCHLHAEIATILKAKKSSHDLSKSTLYIARKLNCNGYGTARPCAACMQAIKDAGIRRIVYTTDSGYAVETITKR